MHTSGILFFIDTHFYSDNTSYMLTDLLCDSKYLIHLYHIVCMEETSAIRFDSFFPCFGEIAEAALSTLEDLGWRCVNTIGRGGFYALVKAFAAGKAAQGKD